MHDTSASRRASTDETLPDCPHAVHATPRLDRERVVLQLLGDARSNVERQPHALLRRALLRKIDKIQFVVDCWGAMPPHPEQISAMLEMILGLHDATELRSHDRGAT